MVAKKDVGNIMHKEPTKASETHYFDEWAKKTSLFQNWEEMKGDVLRHKWYESEKVGHDIGWDRALINWMLRIRNRRISKQPPSR